jgi:hypothetical protein
VMRNGLQHLRAQCIGLIASSLLMQQRCTLNCGIRVRACRAIPEIAFCLSYNHLAVTLAKNFAALIAA